jgi:hypothetical protein
MHRGSISVHFCTDTFRAQMVNLKIKTYLTQADETFRLSLVHVMNLRPIDSLLNHSSSRKSDYYMLQMNAEKKVLNKHIM